MAKYMDIFELPLEEHVRVYAALSDKKRMELLLRLYDLNGEMSFKELKKALRLPSGTLNYHLRLLERAGLIENVLERRSETFSQYKLTEKGREIIEFTYKAIRERQLLKEKPHQ